MPANLENSAVATGLEKVSFHSNPKERQCMLRFMGSQRVRHDWVTELSWAGLKQGQAWLVLGWETAWTAAGQASLSVTNSWSLLKLMSIESVMPSNHLILYHPLLLLPSTFASIRVFSSKSVLRVRWPKYWSFSFSTSPSNEYSELISFKFDWFGLLAVQETLRVFSNTTQFKSVNSSVLGFLYSPICTSIHD